MRRGGCRLAVTVAGGVALGWELTFPWTWVHRSWEVGVCASLGGARVVGCLPLWRMLPWGLRSRRGHADTYPTPGRLLRERERN